MLVLFQLGNQGITAPSYYGFVLRSVIFYWCNASTKYWPGAGIILQWLYTIIYKMTRQKTREVEPMLN